MLFLFTLILSLSDFDHVFKWLITERKLTKSSMYFYRSSMWIFFCPQVAMHRYYIIFVGMFGWRKINPLKSIFGGVWTGSPTWCHKQSFNKNLYSIMKYQYDIFSVIHNFVNLHLMQNKTRKRWLTLVSFCYHLKENLISVRQTGLGRLATLSLHQVFIIKQCCSDHSCRKTVTVYSNSIYFVL